MSREMHAPGRPDCGHPAAAWWRYTSPGQPQRVSCELCGCEDVAACPTWEPTVDDRRRIAENPEPTGPAPDEPAAAGGCPCDWCAEWRAARAVTEAWDIELEAQRGNASGHRPVERGRCSLCDTVTPPTELRGGWCVRCRKDAADSFDLAATVVGNRPGHVCSNCRRPVTPEDAHAGHDAACPIWLTAKPRAKPRRCGACRRTIAPGVSCDALAYRAADGVTVVRPPFALEGPGATDPCNDCGAPVGGFHHPGCDRDYCEHGQLPWCEAGCDYLLPAAAR